MSLLSRAMFGMALSFHVGPAAAETPPSTNGGAGLRFEAVVERNFGSTAYALSASTPDPREAELLVALRSELVFPLDVVFIGGRAAWVPGARRSGRWTLGASVKTAMGDPTASMTNDDYLDGVRIISVESDARLDQWVAALDARYAWLALQGLAAGPLARLDYERIEQHVVGYDGWQRSLHSGAKYDISDTQPVLDYTVRYLGALLGAYVAPRLGDVVRLELRATVGPLVAWDEDDHLKRERTSVGSGLGLGFDGGCDVELQPAPKAAGWLSVRAYGGLRYHYAKGGTTQTFSDGSQYEDIPYVFESVQPQVGLGMAASF